MPDAPVTVKPALLLEQVRQIQEQAWDEGYLAGRNVKPFDSRTHATNPYRKAN